MIHSNHPPSTSTGTLRYGWVGPPKMKIRQQAPQQQQPIQHMVHIFWFTSFHILQVEGGARGAGRRAARVGSGSIGGRTVPPAGRIDLSCDVSEEEIAHKIKTASNKQQTPTSTVTMIA